uniref:Uncharacterized protein n=1 Tax=Myotis myotis TaxID=51298 RepID=A0A7J8AM40_MYOMY|nr:hypothetical protein mMyoMyo1_007811 [Myotis myotis]
MWVPHHSPRPEDLSPALPGSSVQSHFPAQPLRDPLRSSQGAAVNSPPANSTFSSQLGAAHAPHGLPVQPAKPPSRQWPEPSFSNVNPVLTASTWLQHPVALTPCQVRTDTCQHRFVLPARPRQGPLISGPYRPHTQPLSDHRGAVVPRGRPAAGQSTAIPNHLSSVTSRPRGGKMEIESQAAVAMDSLLGRNTRQVCWEHLGEACLPLPAGDAGVEPQRPQPSVATRQEAPGRKADKLRTVGPRCGREPSGWWHH